MPGFAAEGGLGSDVGATGETEGSEGKLFSQFQAVSGPGEVRERIMLASTLAGGGFG